MFHQELGPVFQVDLWMLLRIQVFEAVPLTSSQHYIITLMRNAILPLRHDQRLSSSLVIATAGSA